MVYTSVILPLTGGKNINVASVGYMGHTGCTPPDNSCNSKTGDRALTINHRDISNHKAAEIKANKLNELGDRHP